MGLIKALGISLPTLVSQLINFGLLYWLLKKFALDKLLQAIENRQAEIKRGLDNAKKADEALAAARASEEELLGNARVQAREIIAEAKKTATAQQESILAAAHAQADKIVQDGYRQVSSAREKMLLDVRGELAEIVSIGVERVISEKVSPETINEHYLQKGLTA